MIRTGMMMIATLLVATPALAGGDDRYDRREVARSWIEVQDARRDLARAERAFQRDRAQLYRAGWDDDRGRGWDDDRRRDKRGWGKGGRPGKGPGWQQDGWRQQGWHAEQFYRPGNNYRPVNLGRNDQIFRGYDNRYYCRRSDGTTGLIIGGLAGGALGNVIAPGGSKLLGSLIGGGLGAVLGNSVDRNRVVCR
ncbi:glycine zipper 2TM domain-containing protein [Sandarakinorhabdus sp.]|uniref:glycine zipper 2TM domain-containing protein n=1 Tax=Sandarakinorhabdus sp. TaxID=1916663 RepID=UPI003F7120DA